MGLAGVADVDSCNTTVSELGLYSSRAESRRVARQRSEPLGYVGKTRPAAQGRNSQSQQDVRCPQILRQDREAETGAGQSAENSSNPQETRSRHAASHLRALVLGALDDLKARDVREIDVREKSSVTDLLVVASGTSSRHVKSIAEEVVRKAKQAGLPPIGVEGQREAEWVLVDLGDIVVHVMLPRTREFYGLERLWTVGDQMPTALAG